MHNDQLTGEALPENTGGGFQCQPQVGTGTCNSDGHAVKLEGKCDSTSTSMLKAEASAVWLSMNNNGSMWLMQMTWITSDRLEIPYHSLLLVRSFVRRHDNRPATFLCSVVAYWRAHTTRPPRHFGARFTGRGCRAELACDSEDVALESNREERPCGFISRICAFPFSDTNEARPAF